MAAPRRRVRARAPRPTMPTTAVKSRPDAARFDKAQIATREFRRMLPGLTAFARALTRDPRVSVIMHAGNDSTDGTNIYMRPRMSLGERLTHDRPRCGQRDAFERLACEACAQREDVIITLFHEMAHMVFDSFEAIADGDKAEVVKRAIEESGLTDGSERAKKIAERIEKMSPSNYVEAAHCISPYLHPIINGLEDARVNQKMGEARPGTVKMFKAQAVNVLEAGVEQPDGTKMWWHEYPPNAQAAVALYCKASGFPYKDFFSDDVVAAMDDPEMGKLLFGLKHSRSPQAVYRIAFPVLEVLRKHGLCKSADDPEDEPEGGGAGDESESEGEADTENADTGDDAGESHDTEEGSGASADGTGADTGAGTSAPADDDDTDDDDTDDDDTGAGDDDAADDDQAPDDDDTGAGSDDDDTGAGSDDDDTDDDAPATGAGDDDAADDDDDDTDDDTGAGSDDDAADDTGAGDDDTDDAADDDEDSDDDASGLKVKPGDDDEYNADSEDTADRGTPEDVADALDKFGGHEAFKGGAGPSSDDPVSDAKDAQELDRAVIQGEWFDAPSRTILGVDLHRLEDASDSMWERYGKVEDIEKPSEGVMSKALMNMRITFAENKRAAMERNLKSGRINAKVLGRRVPVADQRLFEKKRNPGRRDYFVVIGLDVSGSTMGRRVNLIKAAAYAQAELLHRMGIKFAVYAHTGLVPGYPGYRAVGGLMNVDIFVVKEPGEPWSDKTRHRLACIGAMHANLDGHTLEFYRKVCDTSNATDKLVMYYTDGAMPCENYEDELSVLQREIKNAPNHNVRIVGVGINNDEPIKHGLDTIRVDSLEDVPRLVRELETRLA